MPKFFFQKIYFSKNKFNNKTKINILNFKPLCCQPTFLEKVKKKSQKYFGFSKMDKNKCPKMRFPKKSWKSEISSLSYFGQIIYY